MPCDFSWKFVCGKFLIGSSIVCGLVCLAFMSFIDGVDKYLETELAAEITAKCRYFFSVGFT